MKLSKLLAALMLLGFIIPIIIPIVNASHVIIDNRDFRVNEGVEIGNNEFPHYMRMEIVEINSRNFIPYAKINFSSYNDPSGTLKTVFQGDIPTQYGTGDKYIEVNVSSVYSDRVYLTVVALPRDWRVTNYYEVEPTATETTTTAPTTTTETVPSLIINKTLDKNIIYPEETVIITINIKNTGNGTAKNLDLNEPAPPIGFDIIAGYPPEGMDSLYAGYKVTKTYVLKAMKPGNYTILPTIINYRSESGIGDSSESGSVSLIVKELLKKLPKLETLISVDKPVLLEGTSTNLNVKITNIGEAPAEDIRIKVKGLVPESVELSNIEQSFSRIEPNKSEEYTATLNAVKNGTYVVELKTVYNGGENISQSQKIIIEKVKKENKLIYLLILIPIILVIAWIYKVHRDYRY